MIHQRGALQLEVKPRQHDRPLVLRTPHAALRVLGTMFRSLVGDTVTRVEVEEGRVEVTRGSDRQKTEVGEGDYLLAGSNREPLRVRAAPITVTEALRTLDDPSGDEHVRAIAYLGDSVLATGGSKGSVKLWDLLSGEIRALSPGHTRLVRSIALAPDGSIFASGSEDRSLRFWDAATGEPAPLPVLTAAATGPLGFSAGGELLAVACPLAGRRWTVRLWSMDTGQCEAD